VGAAGGKAEGTVAGMQGVFQTETLRAFDEAETAKLMQSLL
jgi:hypothetical protein